MLAQRRMHYAEQVAKNGGQPPMPPPFPVEMAQHDPQAPPPPGPSHPFPHPNGPGPTDPSQAGNDFRARFHRSMIVPTPFRAAFSETQPTASTATPSSTSGSAPTEAIDPHLATNANGTTTTSNATTSTTSAAKSETDSSSIFDDLLTTGSP